MKVSGVDITIKKSRRKTVSIFIERDGSVMARVPEQLTEAKIREVLQSREYQIHKHLAEWELLNENRVDREYISGESFLYLGRNYRLKLVDEDQKELKLKNGWFLLGKAQKHQAREAFIAFYKRKLREKLPPIIARYQGQLGVQPNDVKVMELHHRWASCSPSGNVNFHWKCAMAPVNVLHYIVLHELIHLRHPNHTQAFWNEVDKIMPRYEQHIQWLKMNGAGMDL